MLKCLCCKKKSKGRFPFRLLGHTNKTVCDRHVIDLNSLHDDNLKVGGAEYEHVILSRYGWIFFGYKASCFSYFEA